MTKRQSTGRLTAVMTNEKNEEKRGNKVGVIFFSNFCLKKRGEMFLVGIEPTTDCS